MSIEKLAMTNMTNRICMVTGGTSGIGAETALALAQRGATVVVVGRNIKKCAKTVNKIKQITDNSLVDYICADLSSLSQVRHLAKQFKQRHDHLDVLVNNAGAYFLSRKQSVDGYEMTLALNYLSPFVLTNLLIDSLKASTQGRIINVSSNAHKKGKINFDDLQSLHNYVGFETYAQSKLAILLFTYELSRRLQNTKITVNALHPGLIATNFGKNNGWLRFYVRRLLKRGEMSAVEGAQTSVYLATSPDVKNITGGYFIKNNEVKSSDVSYDQYLTDRLWQVSEELTGISTVDISGSSD